MEQTVYPFQSQEVVWVKGKDKTMWPGLVLKVRLFKERPTVYFQYINKETPARSRFCFLSAQKIKKFEAYELRAEATPELVEAYEMAKKLYFSQKAKVRIGLQKNSSSRTKVRCSANPSTPLLSSATKTGARPSAAVGPLSVLSAPTEAHAEARSQPRHHKVKADTFLVAACYSSTPLRSSDVSHPPAVKPFSEPRALCPGRSVGFPANSYVRTRPLERVKGIKRPKKTLYQHETNDDDYHLGNDYSSTEIKELYETKLRQAKELHEAQMRNERQIEENNKELHQALLLSVERWSTLENIERETTLLRYQEAEASNKIVMLKLKQVERELHQLETPSSHQLENPLPSC